MSTVLEAQTKQAPRRSFPTLEAQPQLPSPLQRIFSIVKRELIVYFTSPIAYVFLVIFLALSGIFTFELGGFFERGEASLYSFFIWHPWLYLFLVPAVGMRLWAEERRMGTLELLFTLPVSPWQAIIGKFLASWLFLALALALTFPLILTVTYLGDPDGGVIVCGYLGSLLMAGAYLGLSSMTSAMTRDQVVSFILSVVLCLLLILAGVPKVQTTLQNILPSWTQPWLPDLIASFSVLNHYESFQRGVVDLRDLVYFLNLAVFGLFATAVILRSHRAG